MKSLTTVVALVALMVYTNPTKGDFSYYIRILEKPNLKRLKENVPDGIEVDHPPQ
jgi:hypothetical protein